MKLIHRTRAKFSTLKEGSFLSENDVGEEYGNRLMEFECELLGVANEEALMEVVSSLGLASDEAEMPYEYLSPGLVGACVTEREASSIRSELVRRGYSWVFVRDFCVPNSYVTLHDLDAE